MFVDKLSERQRVDEIEKAANILQALMNDDELSQMPVNYGCGFGICAIQVLQVDNLNTKEFTDKLTSLIGPSATVTNVVTNPDGTDQIRVVAGSSEEVKSISFHRPTPAVKG